MIRRQPRTLLCCQRGQAPACEHSAQLRRENARGRDGAIRKHRNWGQLHARHDQGNHVQTGGHCIMNVYLAVSESVSCDLPTHQSERAAHLTSGTVCVSASPVMIPYWRPGEFGEHAFETPVSAGCLGERAEEALPAATPTRRQQDWHGTVSQNGIVLGGPSRDTSFSAVR